MTAKTIQICADEWRTLPWKKFQKTLFRLQHRIYKAAKSNDKNSVKRLQSLLFGSKCAKYLAVRQVSQLNAGKKNAGVDGISLLNPKERLQLVTELHFMKKWKHRKLKRVSLPKENGEQRLLGIPTLRDKAMQCLVTYALEPVYESYASDGSYGVRPGHSGLDLQNRVFQILKSSCNGYKKMIVKVNLTDCFGTLSHEKIMSRITLPGVGQKFLRSALMAGILREPSNTLWETSQGGRMAPLLCNMILHGIEDLNNARIRRQDYQRGFRYTNDLILVLMPGECGETLLRKVESFLDLHGLRAEEAKTSIVSPVEGFDFLGWHFRVKAKNHKFVCYPSKKNRKQMIEKIKSIMKNSKYKVQDRVKKVEKVYRTWWNYHRFTDMNQVNLWSPRKWAYQYLQKTTKLPGKKIGKYMKDIFNGHTSRMNRYMAARGKKSVYDGDFTYWSKKNATEYTGPLATALKKQEYRCNCCGLRFSGTDWIELHHKNGINNDFKVTNVEALHRTCHQYQEIHREILLMRKRR